MSIALIWENACKHVLYFPKWEHCARMAHNILGDISLCIFVNIKYYNENENVVHLCSWQLEILFSGNYFVISCDRSSSSYSSRPHGLRGKAHSAFDLMGYWLRMYVKYIYIYIGNQK